MRNCRNCKHLLMVLEGDSNIDDFNEEYFKDNLPELFCVGVGHVEIFWNMRCGGSPDTVMTDFYCNHYEETDR